MNVSIDQSRHHDGIAGIVDYFPASVVEGRNARDPAINYMNGRGANSVWRDYTPAADDFQLVSAQNRRRRFCETRRR
jgi:hypothetical protein